MLKTSARITLGGAPGNPGSAGKEGKRRLPGIPAFFLFAAFLVAGVLLAATIVVALAVLAAAGLLIAIVWAFVGKLRRENSAARGPAHRHAELVEEKVACPACGLVFDLNPGAFAAGTIFCPSCHRPVSVHGPSPEQSR